MSQENRVTAGNEDVKEPTVNMEDVTCCQVMYTCCCCTSYEVCGCTVHYWWCHKNYERLSIENKNALNFESYMCAWITALIVTFIVTLVYLCLHEHTGLYYWVSRAQVITSKLIEIPSQAERFM